MFLSVWTFQPSLMFLGKARILPKSGAPESVSTWVRSDFTLKS
jgi:hypothetical protein